MTQLKLFETPLINIQTGKVIPSKSVPLEELDIPDFKDKIHKNKYVIHSTGGYHFFKDVPNALPMFKEQIWPWIEVLKETVNLSYRYAILPRVMPGKGCYIEVTIGGENFLKKIKLHRIVASAFCKNPDPKTYSVVNHINGFKVDYRWENLEWTTHQKNAVGPTKESRIPPDITYKIWELSLNGKLDNYEMEQIIPIPKVD